MKYDFDAAIDRSNTNSLKYDFCAERGKPEGVLPLWVADMDFRAPEEVLQALSDKVRHGVFGYSEPKDDYFAALRGWFSARYGWQPEREELVLSCGVVYALCTLLQVLTKEGDGVLICQPVYYPFEESIRANRRRPVISELILKDGAYCVDFDDFERKIVQNGVKLFLLCNPHNPVGRVWTREELIRLAEICLKHGVFLVSDEIHADFIWGGNAFTSVGALGEKYRRSAAVCTAPTKTFNLAGLHIANTAIFDCGVRARFLLRQEAQGYSQSNVMGIVACRAAYTHGAEWLEQLLAYLEGNLAFARTFFKERVPQISLIEPQGTYLLWLDCRRLALTDEELSAFMLEKAGLWLDDGAIFGLGGSGFERLNMACPRATLEKALLQLERAVKLR